MFNNYGMVRWVFLGCGFVFNFSLVVPLAHAASYNFYFNNIEQGKNGTATPQVTVRPVQASENPQTAIASVPAPSSPAPSSVSQNMSPAQPEAPSNHRFRLGLSFSQVEDRRWNTKNNDRDTDYDDVYGRDQLINLSAALLLTRNFAFTIWAGTNLAEHGYSDFDPYDTNYDQGITRQFIVASEFEYAPLHIEIFGHRDVLDLGARLGLSAVTKSNANRRKIAFCPHWTAFLGLNLNEHIQIAAGFRSQVSVFTDNTYSGKSFEAGLSYRI